MKVFKLYSRSQIKFKMKLLTTALILMLFTTLGFSQETYFGARLGINISNLDFEPDATFENKHRNGLVFGGFVDHEFSESLSLLAELQYSAEGAKDKNLRTDYIQLPVMLRFAIGDWIKIGAGPQAGLKVWSHEDSFKNIVFSGVAGIEYMFTDELFVDARFSYGISNILDDNPALEAKNNNIQFGFGIKL